MVSREVENVCNFLRSKNIQLPSNNEWLSSCVHWYKTHLELKSIYGSLEEYVCIQWLLADLQDVQSACLPTNFKERVIQLNNKYSVQINWVRDIGKSCYSQLQTVQSLDEEESFFSEDEPKKSNWEPKQKRVLMMEITDGVNILKAMEYSPIPKLTEPFLPGTKVVLSGPIECRNGILLLKNDNVTLLGGEVEQLYKKNSLETLLSRCLNLLNESDVTDAGMDRRADSTTHMHRTRSLYTNVENPPNSALVRNDGFSGVNRNIDSSYMMDEDDEFLCELPDEVLDCPEDVGRDNFEPSPVLNVRTFDSNRHSTIEMQKFDNERTAQTPSVPNKHQEINKPKLFPSLEDLRLVGEEPSLLNAVGVSSSSSPLIKSPAIEVDNSLNDSFRSSVNHSAVNNTVKFQSFNSVNTEQTNIKHENDVISVNLCDDESMDYMSNDDNKYPQLRKVEIKIDTISKLKIRNGEWFGCASVIFDNQLVNVTFSNEVLESLFGVSATEVEVWRGEMSTNPSLKKKVNDILKAGQTKLKILKCPMTLEYSSDDCTPQVVAIHMI